MTARREVVLWREIAAYWATGTGNYTSTGLCGSVNRATLTRAGYARSSKDQRLRKRMLDRLRLFAPNAQTDRLAYFWPRFAYKDRATAACLLAAMAEAE